MGIRDHIVWRPKVCLGIGMVCVAIAILVAVLVLFAFGNDCSQPPDLPRSINFYFDGEDVAVSWQAITIQPLCEESFLLRYSVNGGEDNEVSTTALSYTIPQIALCSDIILNLWTVSETNDQSKESLEGRFTAIPQNVYVTDLDTVLTSTGVQVSWQKPIQLASCEASYHIKYSSELGECFDQTDHEYIIIPDEVFCFSVEIYVATVVGYTQTVDGFTIFRNARDLNVRATIPNFSDPYTITITWRHPNEALCSLKYNVSYNLPEFRTWEVEEPILRTNFYYCIPGIVIITPMRLNGTEKGPVTIEYITQSPHPTIINQVQSIHVTRRPEILLVQWFHTLAIVDCSFIYRIEYATEKDTFTNFTTEAEYEIPRTQFCFNLEIEVRGVVDEIYAINPVEELQWDSTADETLIATWTTDEWQEQCELEYVVTYNHGSISRSFSTHQKSATFNRAYCAITSISVKIVYNEAESPESAIAYAAGYPTYIPPVENVTFTHTESSVIVAWDVNEAVSECFLTFTIIGRNDNGDVENLGEGAESYEIPRDDFCIFTEFTIASITSLEEDPAVVSYSCSSPD
ncbi:hypothetical protein QE152_g37555 [Popillia japonica]|uniref:Uncharacterized protein n=1 Tax=Popillia japonica TaxID=7064 RepID=A0AAW1IA73_POPJA